MTRNTIRLLAAASALAIAACGSDNSGGASGSGGHAGGAQGSGGTASGGNVGSGGKPGSGGVVGSGGATGTGGKNGSGGATSSGGSMGSGGASGGSSAGGSTGMGGSSAGGNTGAGGAGSGGNPGTGGALSSGGASAGANGTGGLGTGGKTGVGGTTGTGGTTSNGTGAKLHVFMLLGQSNMAGYAKAQDSDKEGSARIRVIGFDDCSATGRKKDQWADAAPPLHECWNSAVGPGDSFSKTLLAKIPATDSILLVPCALSGKSINDFKKGTTNYTWFISRAKSAQQLGGVIEGLLFHQGESDCGQSTWPNTVKQFVSDLRTDLGLGDTVPFLAGELPPDSACKHNTLVNQLPSLITNAYVVSSSGLKLDPADTQYKMHFGHDDTVEMGKRYEAKLVEALKW